MPRTRTSFQPGQSGNPGGRPSTHRKALQALLDRCWSDASRVRVLRTLIAMAEGGNLDAIRLLLAYTYGKPIERQELSGPDGGSLFDPPIREVIIARDKPGD